MHGQVINRPALLQAFFNWGSLQCMNQYSLHTFIIHQWYQPISICIIINYIVAHCRGSQIMCLHCAWGVWGCGGVGVLVAVGTSAHLWGCFYCSLWHSGMFIINMLECCRLGWEMLLWAHCGVDRDWHLLYFCVWGVYVGALGCWRGGVRDFLSVHSRFWLFFTCLF